MSNRKVREARKEVEKTRYAYRDGSGGFGVPAQVAGEELAKIYDANGVIKPEAVVNAARPNDAPLHPAFEWDDPIAAEKYREWQSRCLIKAVTIIPAEQEQKQIAFVNVQTTNPGTQGYHPVQFVVQQPEMFAIALSRLITGMKTQEAGINQLRELAEKKGDDVIKKVAIALEAIGTASTALTSIQ